MEHVFGSYPTAPRGLMRTLRNLLVPAAERILTRGGAFPHHSGETLARRTTMREKLARGEPVYLLGLGFASHNSGAALIEVHPERGPTILCNNEEERYTGIKHCSKFPELSLADLRDRMDALSIGTRELHACLGTWNYFELFSMKALVEDFTGSIGQLFRSRPELNPKDIIEGLKKGPERLGRALGMGGAFPILCMRHHDNHAYFSYAVSPFARTSEPVMVSVIDGVGDDGSISLYLAKNGELELLYNNESLSHSLGLFYSFISSTQGGWTSLSSEGRYMGAAAWGNGDRQTNPYYMQLRQIWCFAPDGEIFLNDRLANWQRNTDKPYTEDLKRLLGDPVPEEAMWNPDAVLSVEDVQHVEFNRDRLDRAAAVQLVFEDALFHILGHLIRRTGASKLVMTGGCALNCVANMRLLERFDEAFYERYLGRKGTRLHLWVPPTPGDAGVPMGAAYTFALQGGAPVGEPLRHAFYCGRPSSSRAVEEALAADPEIAHLPLGDASRRGDRDRIADFMAYVVCQDGVLGIHQGSAETGPRALGHRSILANPCNPDTRHALNRLVKFREALRPLAPMATLAEARRLFVLPEGARDDEYNAFNYMVMTAMARPEAAARVPAVVHRDGTARVQVVREEIDPLVFAYLKAMGRRAGVEVSVNTSLNVGSPICQTPAQSLGALKKSKGLHGLILVGEDGRAFLAWHRSDRPPKDDGRALLGWRRAWEAVVGA